MDRTNASGAESVPVKQSQFEQPRLVGSYDGSEADTMTSESPDGDAGRQRWPRQTSPAAHDAQTWPIGPQASGEDPTRQTPSPQHPSAQGQSVPPSPRGSEMGHAHAPQEPTPTQLCRPHCRSQVQTLDSPSLHPGGALHRQALHIPFCSHTRTPAA